MAFGKGAAEYRVELWVAEVAFVVGGGLLYLLEGGFYCGRFHDGTRGLGGWIGRCMYESEMI